MKGWMPVFSTLPGHSVFLSASLMVILLISAAKIAAAEVRVALVIGNADYRSSPLNNPVNDARDMQEALRSVGFNVIVGENLNRRQLRGKIREFSDALKRADVGLFYYAGHGVQYQGENFLIPVEYEIREEFEIRDEAVSVNTILRSMEYADNPINIVVLDACRDNPFTRSFRSLSRGLSQMEGPHGSFISFATSPGNVAADGDGKNGLYTQYLLQHLHEPGLKIEEVFKKVRISVSDASSGKQIPWESSSLTGDFYFTNSSGSNLNVTSESDITRQREVLLWEEIKSDPSGDLYQLYLDKYPNGIYSEIARLKIKDMVPPIPPPATLVVRSNVRNDTVNIDGNDYGPTRATLQLAPGTYQVSVTKPGYTSYQKQVTLGPGDDQLLFATLVNQNPINEPATVVQEKSNGEEGKDKKLAKANSPKDQAVINLSAFTGKWLGRLKFGGLDPEILNVSLAMAEDNRLSGKIVRSGGTNDGNFNVDCTNARIVFSDVNQGTILMRLKGPLCKGETRMRIANGKLTGRAKISGKSAGIVFSRGAQ